MLNYGNIYYASTATGKSTLANKYKNVIDMKSTIYKYVGEKGNSEQRKSNPNRILNPQWPQNYFEVLKKVKDEYNYIFLMKKFFLFFHDKKLY